MIMTVMVNDNDDDNDKDDKNDNDNKENNILLNKSNIKLLCMLYHTCPCDTRMHTRTYDSYYAIATLLKPSIKFIVQVMANKYAQVMHTYSYSMNIGHCKSPDAQSYTHTHTQNSRTTKLGKC